MASVYVDIDGKQIKLDNLIEDKPLPRMLFLDDRTKRIESAMKQYAGKYELTIVTNAKECLRYLCRQEFDIVSLDHDLNGDDFQDPDDVTSGMEVVRYIVKCGGFPTAIARQNPTVWIHSSNLFAASKMIDELTKVNVYALYNKFEYENEKKSCDCKKVETKELPENKWELGKYDVCPACSRAGCLDKVTYICYDCYIRELVSSSGMSVMEYWKIFKDKQCKG